MEKTSTVITTRYKSVVDGYEIKYTATIRDGGSPEISGTISMGETRVGHVFRQKDGPIGLNMDPVIPNETIKSISETCIVDTSAIIEDISGTVKSE